MNMTLVWLLQYKHGRDNDLILFALLFKIRIIIFVDKRKQRTKKSHQTRQKSRRSNEKILHFTMEQWAFVLTQTCI